jgi:hypothetical protein
MENACHTPGTANVDGTGRPPPTESTALKLPIDSHPALANLEEPQSLTFQVTYL